MSEWWTYRPVDFLLFSQRVYWRLFELHNQALWPLQIFALLLGSLILLGMIRPRPYSNRIMVALLAMTWVFTAWSFLWKRFAIINWVATYAAAFFVLQAFLLIWLGTVDNRLCFAEKRRVPEYIGLSLYSYALVLHPFMAMLEGRTLSAAEIFGIFPDPLAIATLGLLSASIPRFGVRLLLVVPSLWCLISWLTLDTMEARGAWIPLLAVGLAFTATLWPRSSGD